MRSKLSDIKEVRDTFRGFFGGYGTKMYKGHQATTLLLKNITRKGEILADHVWFTETAGFKKFTFKQNDLVEFCARVKIYKKGYINPGLGLRSKQFDYKLSHPTQIKLVNFNRETPGTH